VLTSGSRDELTIETSNVSDGATFDGKGGRDGMAVTDFTYFGEPPEYVSFEIDLI
jgi:hypothetical protein